MEKIEKLKKILEISSRDTISAKEIEKFLLLVLNTIKEEKDSFKNISDEQFQKIEESISFIESRKAELSTLVDSKAKDVKSLFSQEIDEAKNLLKTIAKIKATPGKDGKDYVLTNLDKEEIASLIEVPIVEKIIEKTETIKEVAVKDTPDQIVEKINQSELVIDSARIDGYTDEVKTLQNRTQLLVQITDGLRRGGSSGGVSGSGTANEIAYFDTTTTVNSLTTTTYPSLTELSYVKGVTSAIQTQLNAKVGALSAIGSSPNANGASISGSTLNLQPASASFGGVVTTGTQSFAGTKTFTGDVAIDGFLNFSTSQAFGGSITASIWRDSNFGLSLRGYAGATYQFATFTSGGLGIFYATTSQLFTALDFSVEPTKKLFLDGGSNTYITESSSDVVKIFTGAGERLAISTTNVTITGDLFFGTDNTYDIGGGIVNPRSGYFKTSLTAPYLYGGDKTGTTYSGYSGAILGGFSTHAVLDFWDNNVRIGEFYTTSNSFNFFTDTGSSLNFYVNNDFSAPAIAVSTGRVVTLSNNTLYSTDNSYDIGASGATRPRTGYFGTSVVAPTHTHTAVTIATLPGTPVAGQVAYVTDGDASLGWGATAVNSGAGATKYLVWYNGVNWTVVGK